MMDRDSPTVEGRLSLQDFVDEYLLRSGRRRARRCPRRPDHWADQHPMR